MGEVLREVTGSVGSLCAALVAAILRFFCPRSAGSSSSATKSAQPCPSFVQGSSRRAVCQRCGTPSPFHPGVTEEHASLMVHSLESKLCTVSALHFVFRILHQ